MRAAQLALEPLRPPQPGPAAVDVALRSQASLAGQVRASLQAVTGVNQDEETANLLMFQQMYQANAKVIAAAGTMFDTILGLR